MKTNGKLACAYCGGTSWHAIGTPRLVDYCQCKYKFMRMGGGGFEVQTTTGHIASEMRKDIMDYLDNMVQDSIVVFKFSVTRLDEEKIAKAKVKRHTKMVADRLLGKGSK